MGLACLRQGSIDPADLVNIMAADGLVMEEGRASAVMLFTQFSAILVSTP